jgi:hypothetical protein
VRQVERMRATLKALTTNITSTPAALDSISLATFERTLEAIGEEEA